MSLGGYQDKMCVAMPRMEKDAPLASAAVATLPYGDAPSTHILKPEPAAYPGAAESEAWAMTVAGHAARCSNVALLDLADAPPTLVVERYDRGGEGWPYGATRIHQEDACQALGLPPNRKYASSAEKGDDPTYRSIANLLLRYSSSFEEEASELLRQVTVNLVLGNWDAHAKNISFLHPHQGAPILAPMYDVVPIAEVEPRTKSLSLRIDGSLAPDAITRSRVLAEAASWGFDLDLAQQVYEACLVEVERGLEAAGKRYPNAAERHETGVLTRLEKLA
jgi:serine/threonine-protein kinase HipA